MLFKECQFNCLPDLISLVLRKQADWSGDPCSLDSMMMSVFRLHSLGAFSTLCAHDVNSPLLLPSTIFIEFSVDCCNSCVFSPKIWFCKLSIMFELFGLCVGYYINWIITCARGIPNSMGWIMLASNAVVCITMISIWVKAIFWPFRMLVVPWYCDDCQLYQWCWLPLEWVLPLPLYSAL